MSQPDTAFCFCVESGGLEDQSVRMVESFRRQGGQFSKAQMTAVQPRYGPSLRRSTRRAFERLEVEFLRADQGAGNNRYSWNHFINKPYAIKAVSDRSACESIGWLDSDLLFVAEPSELILGPDESFLACTSDRIGGTSGPSDPLEPYWLAACRSLGIQIDDLPWVRSQIDEVAIRYYFNSGVFVFRRQGGFADQYLSNCEKMLDDHVSSRVVDYFFTDQIALGLTVFKMGLRDRQLSLTHNYPMGAKTHRDWYRSQDLKAARIVHYHDAMWPDFWETFISCIADTHPDTHDWLVQLGPMQNKASVVGKLMGKLIARHRGRARSRFESLIAPV